MTDYAMASLEDRIVELLRNSQQDTPMTEYEIKCALGCDGAEEISTFEKVFYEMVEEGAIISKWGDWNIYYMLSDSAREIYMEKEGPFRETVLEILKLYDSNGVTFGELLKKIPPDIRHNNPTYSKLEKMVEDHLIKLEIRDEVLFYSSFTPAEPHSGRDILLLSLLRESPFKALPNAALLGNYLMRGDLKDLQAEEEAEEKYKKALKALHGRGMVASGPGGLIKLTGKGLEALLLAQLRKATSNIDISPPA